MTSATITDKIATIVPTAHLPEIAHHTRFMALVHLLQDSTYFDFYKARVDEGRYVILDNSTVELGEPWPMDSYLEEALRLGASEILLPDWLHNRSRTMNAAAEGLVLIRKSRYRGSVMGVPQGSTQREWAECLKDMLTLGICSIGISRRYLDMFGVSRYFACVIADNIALDKDAYLRVHLLGSGFRPEIDVAPCLRLPYVVGVDSAMPSYYTKLGEELHVGSEAPENRVINFVSDCYDRDLLSRNIASWVELCSLP
ncbi:hypothetical protein LCGC14_1383600 [marine sediment metagenome]|uniref:Uncharacterized protein n=1 Tax=marine sediment metagenome TaxID=412755 RepID=A0A0F9N3J2_9ZZZZ